MLCDSQNCVRRSFAAAPEINAATQPGSTTWRRQRAAVHCIGRAHAVRNHNQAPVGVGDRGTAVRMSSFFSKERLKALADQAKAGASQLQSQAQQGLQRMQTQRRTSSREGNKLLRQPSGLQAPPPPLRGSCAP